MIEDKMKNNATTDNVFLVVDNLSHAKATLDMQPKSLSNPFSWNRKKDSLISDSYNTYLLNTF